MLQTNIFTYLCRQMVWVGGCGRFCLNFYTRSYPLDRTASLSLYYFKAIWVPRGHPEVILVADP